MSIGYGVTKSPKDSLSGTSFKEHPRNHIVAVFPNKNNMSIIHLTALSLTATKPEFSIANKAILGWSGTQRIDNQNS